MSTTTGQAIGGLTHLRQSITDILTTPIGSRVMNRAYGSRIYELVDAPMNRETILNIYAATAEALQTWEPRFQLTNVMAASASPGQITLDVTGIYRPDGKQVTFQGIQA